MDTIEIQQLSAFTYLGKGGNPAGVVWPANEINREQRQSIATAAGLSETAFIESTPGFDLKLEYFTPNRQIDICGHATLASFSLLRDQAAIALGHHTFHSQIGKQEVEVMEGRVGLWQKQLFHKEVCDSALLQRVANSIGVKATDLVTPIRHASNGSPFLLIELRDIEILKELQPNQEDILKISETLDLVGYYIFTRAKDQSIDVRMFAPRYGISEESATGMGAGALSLSLSKENGSKHIIIRQGHLMPIPSPSLLIAEIHGEDIVLVHGETTLQKKIIVAKN